MTAWSCRNRVATETVLVRTLVKEVGIVLAVGLALAGCAFLVYERREERSIPTWDGPTTSWTYDSGDYRERRIFDHWRCQDVNCDSAEEADI